MAALVSVEVERSMFGTLLVVSPFLLTVAAAQGSFAFVLIRPFPCV
jgi:hypothetical protein